MKLSLFRLMGQPPARAAWPTLYAATAEDVTAGGYYGPAGLGGIRGAPTLQHPSPQALDRTVARRLWEISEALTGVRYDQLNAGRAPPSTTRGAQ